MPIYPHLCKNCRAEFDVIKKVSQLDLDEYCPMCGELATRQISDSTSFQLKGVGWENNGYTLKSEYNRENVASEQAIAQEKKERGIK
jgi:putative FmdB family regulatory protein